MARTQLADVESVLSDGGDADCHWVLSPLLRPFINIVAVTPVAANVTKHPRWPGVFRRIIATFHPPNSPLGPG